jgi:hypothetical protein
MYIFLMCNLEQNDNTTKEYYFRIAHIEGSVVFFKSSVRFEGGTVGAREAKEEPAALLPKTEDEAPNSDFCPAAPNALEPCPNTEVCPNTDGCPKAEVGWEV